MKFATATAIALTLSSTSAFTVGPSPVRNYVELKASATPYFMEEVIAKVEIETPVTPVKKAPAKKNIKKKGPAHTEGIFSPAVYAAKSVLGEPTLNKIRAKAIGLHTDVIGKFVDTHDTAFGNAASKTIFTAMDKNGDGVVDEEELSIAFRTLGFDWLKEKQVAGILKRADKDKNGVIDYDEFKNDLPKTLRTNLAKLAKKNGNELGFLV
eukprot:CAMPEP_0204634150 /NCGR_PEP_ID=MMETSP0717-20131115/28598_1 /ASSEMBLY_ACC=CAM_ASM_000666 /TAXON_ID=230516 /ORGANISM="Chaetoceros curvisetus" /LENGTH=209 /DNA_ID=CAMNT_0051652493 /DNA_START=152 /DNA_END=781 /DNA_ORIENTATION=+